MDAIWQISGDDINDNVKDMASKIPKELLQKYAGKLHGKTLRDELKLAGLWNDGMEIPSPYGNTYQGFATNPNNKDGKKYVSLIDFDGKYIESSPVETNNRGEILGNVESVMHHDTWYEYVTQYMFHLH